MVGATTFVDYLEQRYRSRFYFNTPSPFLPPMFSPDTTDIPNTDRKDFSWKPGLGWERMINRDKYRKWQKGDKHRKWQRWCGDRIRWLGHLMRTKSSLQSCPTPCVPATAEELVSEREGDRGAAGSITPTTIYNDTGSRLPTQRAITWNNPRSPSPTKLSNTIWSKRKNQSIFLLVSIMDRQDIARASAINLTCFAIAHKCILRKLIWLSLLAYHNQWVSFEHYARRTSIKCIVCLLITRKQTFSF